MKEQFILDVSLKQIATQSRFQEASSAIIELAHQIVGPRTFFVSYIDATSMSILNVVDRAGLNVKASIHRVQDSY